MNKFFNFLFGILLLFNQLTIAIAQPTTEIPQSLQTWNEWVLHPHPDHECVWYYNYVVTTDSIQTPSLCQWSSYFTLAINTKSEQEVEGKFTQQWQLYSPGWITLPGSVSITAANAAYPQSVTINGQPAIVIERNGLPSVYVDTAGQMNVAGQLSWQHRPEFLQLPSTTGIVSLTVDGSDKTMPDLDDQGRLWLQQRTAQTEETLENTVDLKVYRQVIDNIPLQVITQIELQVSGRHREIVLGPVLLPNHSPMMLDSLLPARLEPDGSLRLQVNPGTWSISLTSRQLGKADNMTLPKKIESANWVDEEIWVFAARNDLRLVEITGVIGIDPQQTNLPDDWKRFPTYLVKAGDTLTFEEKRRGDAEPAPDQLSLNRQLWLDFDGKGYSVQDRITGTMTQGWRLELAQPAVLGRVNINGQDQFITRLTDSSNSGVEVRNGQIELVADSRLEEATTALPAVGWNRDFHNVHTVLHLPPGWRLFEAMGVDNVPDTWLKRWTLLDLFVVLVTAFAIGKLWSWRWGVISFITLALIYQETQGLGWLWLNLIASIALLRVLPSLGFFSRFVRFYRNIWLIILLIAAIPFMVQQIRQAIYPQLEFSWKSLEDNTYSGYYVQNDANNIGGFLAESAMPPMPQSIQESSKSQEEYQEYKQSSSMPAPKKAREKVLQIDPNVQVQTGRGLPQWDWRSIDLNWSGPVEQQQEVTLWLLSPMVNSGLAIARVLFLAVLVAFFLNVSWGQAERLFTKKETVNSTTVNTASAFLVMLLVTFLMHFSPTVSAEENIPELQPVPNALIQNDLSAPLGNPSTLVQSIETFPPDTLLNELEKRLLEVPDCLPTCASVAQMALELGAQQLRIRLAVHSQTQVAIPLPGIAKQWLAQKVWLDNQVAQSIQRDKQGQLWLTVPEGIHQVLLEGELPNRNTIQLALPLKPATVTVQATEWRVDGIHENGVSDQQLQFTREQKGEMAELETGNLPPFIQIERTLLLGLEWNVETTVTRLTPLGSAVVLEVPLLAGESVTSENIHVNQGKVLLNLPPHESSLSWTSTFEKQDVIQLIAPESSNSSEIWRLDASPIWHVEVEGIPVIHHQNEGRWLPEWRPWAGESVILKPTRPSGVGGQIVTIDRSELTETPGQRSTDTTLLFTIRSSRGGQQSVKLPADSQLLSVTINDQSQPIRQEGQQVTLPLVPGSQKIMLSYRQAKGLTTYFQTASVDLGISSVSSHIQISMPESERWIFFVGGLSVGPAVLIWGIIILVILVSIGLSRVPLTPLTFWQWFLIGVVLSQVEVGAALVVVGWFMLLGWRARLNLNNLRAWQFDLLQIALAGLTVLAASIFVLAIQRGLLGHPNMYIEGNGSNTAWLHWYQDQVVQTLPQVWVISLPILVYHIAMLIWAVWLSFNLLKWSRWGWECFSQGGLWKTLWTRKAIKSKIE